VAVDENVDKLVLNDVPFTLGSRCFQKVMVVGGVGVSHYEGFVLCFVNG